VAGIKIRLNTTAKWETSYFLLLTIYDSDAQFKVMWMSSACGTYGLEEKCDLVGNLMDTEHAGRPKRRWENNI
jgi:hypothetical protein